MFVIYLFDVKTDKPCVADWDTASLQFYKQKTVLCFGCYKALIKSSQFDLKPLQLFTLP